jgi:hypothetical protein
MFGKHNTRATSSWRLLLGLLCIALVIFSGTLSVTHVHSQGEINHADCGLCVSAHLSAQLVSPAPEPAVARVFARIEEARPVHRAQTYFASNLFTRPPPANAHLS